MSLGDRLETDLSLSYLKLTKSRFKLLGYKIAICHKPLVLKRFMKEKMERETGFEPATLTLATLRSTS